MKKFILLLILLLNQPLLGVDDVKISGIKGDVRYRSGMEEDWHRAGYGMLLKNIDTILTGENSEVTLELEAGIHFVLDSHAILDIGDLRKITERELFLFLMSQKVSRIEYDGNQSVLHIENVSVVRAEKKSAQRKNIEVEKESDLWSQETNGAKALFRQSFYPNAIVKFHKILNKYTDRNNDWETYYYLAKSFEAIQKPGRARDAYQKALDQIENQSEKSDKAKGIFMECFEALRRVNQ